MNPNPLSDREKAFEAQYIREKELVLQSGHPMSSKLS